MGRFFAGFFFALLLPFSSFAADPAPDFTLPTATGKVSLSEFKGKVVYLDFWASWCTPCRQSFPWMNELQERFGKDGFRVLAVNVDEDRDMANKFLAAIPAQFTVAFDPEGRIAEKYRVQGMPSSYLIDKQGRIQRSHVGFRDADREETEAAIARLLKQ